MVVEDGSMTPQLPRRRTYEFTVELTGPDVTADENFQPLADATDDGALFRQSEGRQFADFDIEATSFPEAVREAFQQLEGALPDLRVIRIEPEDLVAASDVAERTGRTRQSVSLLIKGRRGPGGFPAPVAHVGSGSPLWSWSDVSHWFARSDEEFSEEPLIAEFTAAVNAKLEAREHQRRMKEAARRQREVRRKTEGSNKPPRRRRKEPTPTFALAAYMQRGIPPTR